jgi:hypothetical protein
MFLLMILSGLLFTTYSFRIFITIAWFIVWLSEVRLFGNDDDQLHLK